jgi:hypothetical protein
MSQSIEIVGPLDVRLMWIEGEAAAELSDLIGQDGTLTPHNDAGDMRFVPDRANAYAGVVLPQTARDDGKYLRITGRTGSVFVFRK